MRRALLYSRSYRQAVMALGPVAYWRLGEASGTVARDEMGKNNGSYDNTPTLGVAGALSGDSDTAATFASASAERITIGGSAALDHGDTFSFAAWVKRATTGVTAQVIYGRATGGPQFYFASDQVTLDKNGTGVIAITTATFTSTTGWYFVAVTKTGAAARDIYVNGVAQALGTSTDRTLVTDSVSALTLAARTAGNYPFDGTIDDPAIWNRALNASEIARLYAVGRGF